MGMSASAFLWGLGTGWLTDRLGPKPTQMLSAGAIGVAIVAALAAPGKAILVPVILVFGSGGLAGTWVAGRKWLLVLAPEGKAGEYFGLYGVTNKLSVIGMLLFAALGDWTGTYRASMASLLVTLGAGLVFLALARTERPAA
jgi:UMF1 family MFS transporter